MTKKTRGGREIIDQLLADLADIDDAAAIDLKDVIFDPRGAYEALVAIIDQVAAMRRRIREQLEPMLERTERNREAAAMPDRLTAVEAELAELRRLVESRSLRLMDPPRPTGTGGKD